MITRTMTTPSQYRRPGCRLVLEVKTGFHEDPSGDHKRPLRTRNRRESRIELAARCCFSPRWKCRSLSEHFTPFFLRPLTQHQVIVQPKGATGEEEKHVVFTVQPRIAAASLAFVEIPAGMLDGGSLAGKAATELKEEADLTVEESELTNMSKLALNLVRVPFPSPTSLQIVELPA
jgi:hypothetical protein